MNELNNKIERIFAEYVGKISLNPDTSNYIGKEDWENTQATLKELQALITEQVRLGRQNIDQAIYLAEKKGYERGLKDGQAKGERNARWHVDNQTGHY